MIGYLFISIKKTGECSYDRCLFVKAIPATKPPTTITPINDHNAGPIPVAVLPPTITPVKDLNTAVLPVAVLPTTIAPVKDLSTQVLPVAVPLNTGLYFHLTF